MDITACTTAGSTAEVWLNAGIAFRVQNAYVVPTPIGQTRSHAAVLKLNVGDQLYVKIPNTSNACFASGASYGTSFAGLLLG